MGWIKELRKPGHNLYKWTSGLVRVTAVLCIALLLTTCGASKSTSPITPTDGSLQAPTAAELTELLHSEFARLGIDPSKVVAAAPNGSDNAVFDLSATILGESGIELSWTERIIGDYDQNGEVNLTDITPMVLNWGSTVAYDDPALHGGFDRWPSGDPDSDGALNWRKAGIDGDGNGEINTSDITPIVLHFQEVNHGYQIERAINYGTGSLDWEAIPLDIGFGIQPSAPRETTANYSQTTPARYLATVPLEYPEFAHYFRVKPYDEISETSGELSNVAEYLPSTTIDIVPPYWLDPVGVTKLIPGDESMTVEFGTATDDASPPVSYRVYWAEGDEAIPDAPFDFAAAQFMDIAFSPYTITGLTNDQYYRVAVRAMDSADVPNIEVNTVLLGRTAGATDIYPPEWQGETGLQLCWFGNGDAVVGWGQAVDYTVDEFGEWSNGPVIYTLYYGPGQVPDWDNAQSVEYVDTGLENNYARLIGLDTTVEHWFVLRARDQAQFPNEDWNTVSIQGLPTIITRFESPGPGPAIPEGADLENVTLVVNPLGTRMGLAMDYITGENNLWSSFYDFNEAGFAHNADLDLGSFVSDYQINGRFLTSTGEYRVAVKFDWGISEQVLKIYQLGEPVRERTFDGNPGFHRMFTNIDDDIFVLGSSWNGDPFDPRFSYYLAAWDQDFQAPYYETTVLDENFVVYMEPSYLNNSDTVFISAVITDLGFTYYESTVSPDATITLDQHAPYDPGFRPTTRLNGRNSSEPIWTEISLQDVEPRRYVIYDSSSSIEPPTPLGFYFWGAYPEMNNMQNYFIIYGYDYFGWLDGFTELKTDLLALTIRKGGAIRNIPRLTSIDQSVGSWKRAVTDDLAVIHVDFSRFPSVDEENYFLLFQISGP